MLPDDELAIIDALGGDLAKLEALASRDPRWRIALGYHRRLNDLSGASGWEWPHAHPDAPSVHALVAAARAAAFALVRPPPELAAQLEALRAPGALAGWASIGAGWARLASGEPPRTIEVPEVPGHPALRVERATMRAVALLEGGRLAEAQDAARLATRMANAEAIRGAEYAAYFALARARRKIGLPYAAARILGSLRRGAPAAYAPLLDVERVLAGDAEPLERAPASAVLAALVDALAACGRGDAEGLAGALAALAREAEGTAAGDALALANVAQQDAVAAASEEAEPGDALPRPFDGALWAIAERLGTTPGLVLAGPGEPSRRALALGVHAGRTVVSQDEHGERAARAVAILALAGPEGLDDDTFFRRAYGFPFRAATHDGVLRVLVHRLRSALAAEARIERGRGRISLTPVAPIAVQDPSTRPGFGDRVLRLVASRPGLGAREIAAQLGSSVRAVQAQLQLLVDTGACRSEKEGRHVAYAVEDTTFSEPTHLRLPRR